MLQHAYKNLSRGIFIGLGANLFHARLGHPALTLLEALRLLDRDFGIRTRSLSGWFQSAPVPPSDQHWYVNAVAEVSSPLAPSELLLALHAVEAKLGRIRSIPDAARTVDLDLIDHAGRLACKPGTTGLKLPHPRCAGRRFVLYPLRDLAPRWLHPRSGEPIDVLISRLPPQQFVRRIVDGPLTA